MRTRAITWQSPDTATRWCLGILAVNAAVQVAVRLLVSETAELDESEQLLLTQSLARGYTDQPPLYTWLQALVFAVAGVNLLSLALLKNLLLLATHAFLFLTARRMLGDASAALLAALSLWLIPQFVWESQRDLTHSVLVTAVSAATLYVAVELREGGRTRQYALLGVLLGFGTLSKYSFVVFALALLAAALGDAAFRARLLDRRLALATGIAGMICLPHLLWLVGRGDDAVARAAAWLVPEGRSGALRGVLEVGWAAVRFVMPLGLVWLALFPGSWTARPPANTRAGGYCRLLERFFGSALLVVLAGVVVLGMGDFKDRWLQPLLFPVPLYLFLRLRENPVQPGRLRIFAGVLALSALVAVTGRLAQVSLGPRFGIHSRLSAPFTELAAQLRAAGFVGGTIVADAVLVGGNLRLAFPESRVLTPGLPVVTPDLGPAAPQCLFVWKADPGQGMPAHLREWLPSPGDGGRDEPPRYAVAPRKHQPHRPYRLGFVLRSSRSGACA